MCEFLSFCIDEKENVYVGDLYTHDSIYKKYKGNVENLIEVEWTSHTDLEIRSDNKSFYESSILGRWKNRADLLKYIFDNQLSNNILEAYYNDDNDFLYAIEDSNGSKYWYKNGLLHRDNDEPAIVYCSGTKYWYKDGLIHRDNDEPAIICSNGYKQWYKNGLLHRDNDEPSIIDIYGYKAWYKNGFLHRENDEPAIIDSDGSKLWYKNGEFIKNENPYHRL